MSMPRCSAYHARNATGSLARKKTPPTPSTASPTYPLPRLADELREDIPVRTELRDPLVLPLGGVRRRHREVRRRTDLVGDGEHPFDQRLDPRASRDDLAALEVDQSVAQSMPDRAPHVLLDEPVREIRKFLPFVERACEPRPEGVDQRRQRLRLLQVGLRVADPNLDGRIRQVRAHAPPDLRVLVDRSRRVEEANVLLVRSPASERVRNAAAREQLRKDLRSHRVETGDAVLDK